MCGIVTFVGLSATHTMEKPGVWLVHVVHMVPASTGADFDWRSYWASLTFETTR